MYRLLIILLFLTSCGGIAPNRMFRTPDNFPFSQDSSVSKTIIYLIQPGDKIAMHIYSNNGFKLVDITQFESTATGDPNAGSGNINYTVDVDSTAKFPIVGRIAVVGLSIREIESRLETLYSKYYNQPFITVNITNRTAIVFLTDQGKGVVVQLVNENTTLYEALALSGGIGELGRSYNIRILRGDPRNPNVYKADLSTIEALKSSELRVLSNDIIYVDAGSRFSKRLSSDVLPALSLLSTIFLILNYVIKK